MRRIDKIIIHCSDTPDNLDITAEDIESWHIQRGFDEIGYHYVVLRDGIIIQGRDIERIGAHTKGHNTGSIGVCWVGKNYIGYDQMEGLLDIVYELCKEFEISSHNVYGHYEFNDQKTCPNLDMDTFRELIQCQRFS